MSGPKSATDTWSKRESAVDAVGVTEQLEGSSLYCVLVAAIRDAGILSVDPPRALEWPLKPIKVSEDDELESW